MVRMSSVDRRAEIVHAALRVIAKHGVHGATTRAIVAEAGMSLASFHYAFASRDAMMQELIAFVVEDQTVAAFQTMRFDTDIRTIIRDGLQSFFDTVAGDPNREQVLLELMLFAMREPSLRRLPERQWANYRLAAIEVLTAAAEGAGRRWTRPVEEIALMLITYTDGITLSWLATRDSTALSTVMDLAADALAALSEPHPAPLTSRTKDRSV
jgi:AcrR family transcriptional regulator